MEYIFLLFFSFKQQLLSLSNFKKQSQSKKISSTTLLHYSSRAYGFFNILTAKLINDLNDSHHKKPKSAIKGSKSSPVSHVIHNPLYEFSNSEYQTNNITIPTGITSPPPFHTKRPINLLKWHDSNYFRNENNRLIPKRITNFNASFINSTKSSST